MNSEGPPVLSQYLVPERMSRWRGDYSKLEYKHGFIQWL